MAKDLEITFPDQSVAEANVLAQELRHALLRAGADANWIHVVKERSDTMDLASAVRIALDAYQAYGPVLQHMLEPAMPVLTALHCARILYEICAPAHSGVQFKTPQGVSLKLGPSEVTVEGLQKLLEELKQAEGNEAEG